MFMRIMSKWFLALAMIIVMAIIVFCGYYFFSDYHYLVKWFLQTNNCFYRHNYWTRDFFTADVKKEGDMFCVAGFLLGVVTLYIIGKQFRQASASFSIKITRPDIYAILVCLVLCTFAWIWGNSLVHQGFDEVFSAVNCASLPPLQVLSYYMLPNNHILFNFLNSVLFHFAPDKVLTGKLISLVCYWGIIIAVFYFLSQFIKDRLLVIIATLVICFQFPVWGFGFEARGYEFCNLSSWVSFLAVINYAIGKQVKWLYLLSLFSIIGYFTIPTFLCFHIGVLLFGVIWMLIAKSFDKKFWLSQLFVSAFVYLLYLPAICFSGLQAFTANRYVTATTFTFQAFYKEGLNIFTDYLNYYSSNFILGHNIADLILFLLPLALFLFYKNKVNLLLASFYVAIWLSCITVAYAMKIYPIDRSMGAQINISLALSMYALYLMLFKPGGLLRKRIVINGLMVVFLLALGIHFGIKNQERVNIWLYHNNINDKYDILTHQGIDLIPAGSSVACSDECFYWYYFCQKKGCIVSKCGQDNEQYYIRLNTDPLPAAGKKYILYRTIGDYEMYKRE